MTLFEIIHYFIDNQKKHNPFDVALAEFFHDDCRARLVIEILNKIGLYISYDECQRIDFGLMKQVIKASGSNRVSISLSIDKKILMKQWIISTTMKQHHQKLDIVMTFSKGSLQETCSLITKPEITGQNSSFSGTYENS